MKETGWHRLQRLRMETDEAGERMDSMRSRFERIGNRHEDKTAPRAVTAYQLFQTPPEVAAQLVAALELNPGARILEPSAGLGRILDALRGTHPAEVVAVESANACAEELFRQDRENVRLYTRDFLTVSPSELGTFDAVAMNPPFHMRSDIAHIRHALQFLRPGGILAALCMDTHHRAAAFRDMAETWHPLPAGTFRQEGTNVPTILFTLRK